jgi:hypothetical protein
VVRGGGCGGEDPWFCAVVIAFPLCACVVTGNNTFILEYILDST